jgi:transcriptional regulator
METLTTRRQIILLLQQERLGARELSQALGLPEKEVYRHLEHIARTARRLGYLLETEPKAACLACGFIFKERQRLTPPGRCPRCRATHLSEPFFHLEPS